VVVEGVVVVVVRAGGDGVLVDGVGSGRRGLDGGVGLVFRRLGLGGMGREGR